MIPCCPLLGLEPASQSVFLMRRGDMNKLGLAVEC